jgi:hypothetical protein
MMRGLVAAFGLLASVPAMAGEMSGVEAKQWVTGKLFTYNCFEGTRGAGRVFADGSVIGTVQFHGAGPVRRAFLPANTLHVKNGSVCASLKGMPIEPCFNLDRTDSSSFRGSISGLGFAYCDFKHHNGRANLAERVSNKPMSLRPAFASGE